MREGWCLFFGLKSRFHRDIIAPVLLPGTTFLIGGVERFRGIAVNLGLVVSLFS